MLNVKFIISALLLTWASSSWAVLFSFDMDAFNFSGGGGSASWIHDNPDSGSGVTKLWKLNESSPLNESLTVTWDDNNNDGLLTGLETISSASGETGSFAFESLAANSLDDGKLIISNFMLTIGAGTHSDGGSLVSSASFDWEFDLVTGTDVSGTANFGNIDMGPFNRVILDNSSPNPLSTILWGELAVDRWGIDLALIDPDGGNVPEPTTIALFGLGLLGMVGARRQGSHRHIIVDKA